MKTMQSITIPKFKFSEPRHNLPGRKGVATKEDLFTIKFARSYAQQFTSLHRNTNKSCLSLAREIPVNGYGIADLLVVAWANDSQQIAYASSTVRAFELKITNWRKAMTQGSRYRFFANQAIVVLPPPALRNALPFLDTFKKIKVGLWGFCTETEQITACFTPRPQAALSMKYYGQAIEKTVRAANLALPIS